MLCEMCSGPNATTKVEIEGSKLTVCEKCSKYGKVLGKLAPKPQFSSVKPVQTKQTETVQIIVSDYPRMIRNAREKTGLKQEEMAKRLNIKESLYHSIESGRLKPDLELARRIEKAFKITLVEQLELSPSKGAAKHDSESMTLGDLINIK